MDSQTVPTIIRKAVRLAQMEKPGSVVIVVPEKFLTQKITNKPFPFILYLRLSLLRRPSWLPLLLYKTG